MKKLLESCDRNLLLLNLPAPTLDVALRAIVEELVRKGTVAAEHQAEITGELERRQRLSTTAIGHSLAVPHAYLECVAEPVIVIVRLLHGINAGAPDGAPTRFVFLLLGPPGATEEHLDSLANIAKLMSDDEFRYLALAATTPQEFRQAIEVRMSGESAVAHHAAIDEGLRFTGQLFGGIRGDIRRRAGHYVSDFVDGLDFKCLGSTFFLFFACLAPAIIFGGLMHGETGGQIGAVEMIVATAVGGLIYALASGQPMIILGGTGPMLIFTGILYEYCQSQGIAFLPAYAWVGLWTGLILLILAVTDASCLMQFFTRFTDETFATLISVIFIYEAVEKLIDIFHRAEVGATIGYDVALLSLLLALGTFYVATSLRTFRKSHLLVHSAREFLSDFGPTVAIMAMTVIAFAWRGSIELEPLPAPDHFQTTTGRPWLVPFLQAPPWVIGLSIVPALLCTVLVYLDQNITARLVNSPDNNLQKGESYHHDLALVGLLLAVFSVFGLPWLVAATVRSLNHVRSLATTEEVVDRSGRAHTHVLHVRENRVTALSIHLLIGLSLLLLPLLTYIPLAVLFGLFLYMGVVSLKGNQFFERLCLWATDPELYPRSHYVRRVPRRVLHLFTFVQLACFLVLWLVKTSAWAILFPLFIALLVPIRYALRSFFSPEYLSLLDAEVIPEEEEEVWAG